MIEIVLSLIFISSFLFTAIFTPKYMKKASERGYVVKDMYKRDKPSIPAIGGLVILASILTSLIVALIGVNELGIDRINYLLIFYFIVIVFGIFGLADDLFHIEHKWKIIAPFFLAMPIVALISDTTIDFYFIKIDLGLIYTFIIAPMYIMVVANLINMHSGYNGLSCGLSYILVSFIMIRVYFEKGLGNIYLLLPVFGSLLAFLYYNTYPAKIFWGNIGSIMIGAAIGSLLIVNKMEIFGIVILIPHIINFLMYVIWKIKGLGDVKFGGLRDDGTLIVPNPWTLKWLFPYYFRLTEHQSMWILYMLTTFFGLLGIIFIPYHPPFP